MAKRIQIEGISVSPDHYINGQRISSPDTFEDRSPLNWSNQLARISRGNSDTANLAVEAATKAFPLWASKTASERAAYMNRLADIIDTNINAIAKIECIDMAMLEESLRKRVIPRAAENFRLYAELASTYEERQWTSKGTNNRVARMPAGPALVITPWNAPFMLSSWKCSPALAAGNTVILKPAEWSPLTASLLADFIEEELRKANELYASEIEEKESAITELQEQQVKLSTESKETEKALENVQAELTTLKEEKAAKEAEETFNMRMSQMDEEYELTDEDREVIATDVKDLDDENFSNYLKKMGVLLRNKNKQVLAEAKATAEAEDAEKATEVDAEATKEEVEVQQEQSEEIVDEVLEEAEADAQEIPASSEAQDETLYDKYKNAFGLAQFDINVR